MIPINTLLGVLACLVCLLAGSSLILLLKARDLYERSIAILVCVHDWLEQYRLEVHKHEGTD